LLFPYAKEYDRTVKELRRYLLKHYSVRLLFVTVLCAMMLNGVANLTHRHVDSALQGGTSHAELCGYCATFGSLGTAPIVATAGQLLLTLLLLIVGSLQATPKLRRFVTSARPRAPPYS
jgi:uncharacterized YccA/Bax inhibitor family protein